jgi:hypothetical protein
MMMPLFWPYASMLLCVGQGTQTAPYYRADLLAEMQDTLKALADIKARREVEREQVQGDDAQTTAAEAA